METISGYWRNFLVRGLAVLPLICLQATVFVTAYGSIIAAQAAPTAKAFGELPVGYDGAISPNGTRIALIINVNGTYGITTQPLQPNGEKPWVLSLGQSIKPGYIKWVNNERFVVSVKKSQKLQNTPFTTSFLFTGDIKSRKGRMVIKPQGFFRQFNDRVVDWLEDDPEHILMAYSDEQNDPYPDIKKVKVATGKDRTVKRGQPGIEYWSTDEDGKPLIGTGTNNKGTSRRVIYNADRKKWEDSDNYPGIDPKTPIFGIIKKGTELVIGDYRGKDTLGLYVYNLAQKKIVRTLFHNETYDASGVVLSTDGETIIGAKYTAENDKIELLGDNGTLLDKLRTQFSDYNVDFVDQTADGRTVLVDISCTYTAPAMTTLGCSRAPTTDSARRILAM